MKTHNERAAEAVTVVLGLVALLRPTTKAQLKVTEDMAISLIAEIFAEAQDELLASQQETAVALAAALNMANGK